MQVEQPTFRTRLPIDAYGDMGFRIGGLRLEGSVLLLSESMEPWEVARMEDLSIDALKPVLSDPAELEFLILGCGSELVRPQTSVVDHFRSAGLGLEFMDTGAACRLYNLLVSEGRSFAAALIAVE